MHRLKSMKETLISCVQAQLSDIASVDTKELGEAIDMIKDLEEAIYYCHISKAMEESEKERDHCHIIVERDMDRDAGRMYYTERPMKGEGYYPMRNAERNRDRTRDRDMDWDREGESYHEREVPLDMRDRREGRSPMSRRNYMESKEMHHGKEKKLKELEQYMKELSEDIVEMIQDASPEEKQMLEKKMTHLTSKIAQLNTTNA